MLLSWHLLRDSIHLKFHKECIKSNVMFLENIWMHCGNYVSKMTSKSSNMTNVSSHVQFFMIKRRTYDLMTVSVLFRYGVPKYHVAFVYL